VLKELKVEEVQQELKGVYQVLKEPKVLKVIQVTQELKGQYQER
jgi:deoxyribose-phosphate aldolase